jgi:hypothetical protein
MVADAPKEGAEHAHGPPGGGMGDMGMSATALQVHCLIKKPRQETAGASFVCWLQHMAGPA